MTQTAKTIDEEAAHWAIRLGSGSLSPEERRELDAWLSNGPRHHGALIRARATWLDLDRLAVLAAGARTGTPGQPSRFGRRYFLAAAVIMLAVFASAGGWWFQHTRGETFASEVGQQREVKLADGSSMVLNTASKANVDFDADQREIKLIEGEVLFDVAKDRTRPFIVHAGDVRVTAIGTAFAVRREDGRVAITVTEGVVEVVHREGGTEVRRRLVADQTAVATESEPVAVVTLPHDEVERRLAWRRGLVMFNGEPLREAAAEMNRHSKRKLIVDPKLADSPMVGIFRANDTETFVSAATAVLNAQAVASGDVIELRAQKTR